MKQREASVHPAMPQADPDSLSHLFTDNEVPEAWKSNPKDHPPLKSAHKQPADRANKSQVPGGTLKILFENIFAVLPYHLPTMPYARRR